MSLLTIQDSTLADIADAIREKTGKSASMTPLEMPDEIKSISGGGSNWETIFSDNDVYVNNDAGGGYYYGTIPWSEPITLNSEWKVIWDGVSYECTATWEGSPDGSPYAIGNPTFDGGQGGNNEPFLMQMYWGTSLVIVAEVAKSYDIVIQRKTSGGGGGNVAAINILDGVSIVPGYINSGGSVSDQSSTSREITTDYVDVSDHLGGYIYTAYIGNPGGAWFAYAFYDSSHNIVGSRTTYSINNANDVLSCPPRIAIPASGVKYVRISFRTYGHAAFAAAYEPMIDAMTADGWSSYQTA